MYLKNWVMRSNYKQLGNYIEQFDIRNKDCNNSLELEAIKGISSISKSFIKTKANLVGVSPGNYKVVEPKQFGFNPNTARMGDKIPIALNSGRNNVLVSSIYPTFKIIDANLLLPEYLMMWFRRPEFDRYARFKSHGSAREIFDYSEMCEVELPVPSIEKQREIVKEYNTIVNRIKLNEKLNQKLEETAQALYKHWFVDFEFPNENGQPYKSSGGKMVYNEELDLDIPELWESEAINSFCTITSSKRIFEHEYVSEGVPFFRAGEIKQKKQGVPIKDVLYISESRYNEIVNKFGQPESGDILLTAVGSLLGESYLVQPEKFYFKDGNVVWFKDFNQINYNTFIYGYLQSNYFQELLDEIKIGSGQSAITIKGLGEKHVVKPKKDILNAYAIKGNLIFKQIAFRNKKNLLLHELNQIILSRMSKMEALQSSKAL